MRVIIDNEFPLLEDSGEHLLLKSHLRWSSKFIWEIVWNGWVIILLWDILLPKAIKEGMISV